MAAGAWLCASMAVMTVLLLLLTVADRAQGGAYDCHALGSSNFADRASFNDGFCDCTDGSDEPRTGTCDGGPRARFHCANVGFVAVALFPSRVNDGVCDCCDGSDEISHSDGIRPVTTCPSDCAERAAAWDRSVAPAAVVVHVGLVAKELGVLQSFEALEALKANLRSIQQQIGDTQLKNELKRLRAARKELRGQVRMFGPRFEWLGAVTGGNDCAQWHDARGEYAYTVCPFDRIIQSRVDGGGSPTLLGRWKAWESSPSSPPPPSFSSPLPSLLRSRMRKRSEQLFDRGDVCYQGPPRSARLVLSCGAEGFPGTITAVEEPGFCEYVVRMRVAAVCDRELDTPRFFGATSGANISGRRGLSEIFVEQLLLPYVLPEFTAAPATWHGWESWLASSGRAANTSTSTSTDDSPNRGFSPGGVSGAGGRTRTPSLLLRLPVWLREQVLWLLEDVLIRRQMLLNGLLLLSTNNRELVLWLMLAAFLLWPLLVWWCCRRCCRVSHSSSDENNDKNPAEARSESPAAFTSALWLRQKEEEDHAMARTHSEGAAVRGKYLADEVAAMSPFVGTQNRDYVGAFART